MAYTKYNDDENILSIYLKEINKIPLLTREEEDDIARKAVKGDQIAKDRLVRSNLRFVVNVSKKYQNQGLPLDDLISEGNIGLINAIEKYDPEKGYHFISYAVWWIRQSILKAVYEKSRMIRLPLNRANELVQIEKVRKELTKINGEDPDAEEISNNVGIHVDDVKKLMNISRDLVSLESPTHSEDSVLGDFIEDDQYKTPDNLVMDILLSEDINSVLSTLTPKESEILEKRFGLNGIKPLSLKEIGDHYGLTKERIRQIEKKAITRLQHPSRIQFLKAYVA
ncbi:RNA polymerase sigma factor RpoD/SigA [Oceanispirochaeta sp.]|jgi:RNA polymerase primary sigma factor|uniref:sigma-70 family RNA polymerase sigma factor n=1 Tax=Oceanispirochaeta sp. TaxID=2035350 RepID=UPI002618887F|nr:RNA polymerase sigma factor RpoD/SigA [Oceanispirochaeta sp.]MDA3956541.1 RNA polymerase sigma factor RpoD/SigA [Oceanispirochaeta sp.]